ATPFWVGTKKDKFIEYTGKVELWDTATGELLEAIPMDTAGNCVAFAAKGGMLAVGCQGKHKILADRKLMPGGAPEIQANPEGVIRIWDLRDLGRRTK
ncbi:MAG: hypothetical protein L0191_20440, partial [Acidobacteria bacterium]|nr:hypothetical protein [Acidobacteriota bacterium]